jgi:hypothetical protein
MSGLLRAGYGEPTIRFSVSVRQPPNLWSARDPVRSWSGRPRLWWTTDGPSGPSHAGPRLRRTGWSQEPLAQGAPSLPGADDPEATDDLQPRERPRAVEGAMAVGRQRDLHLPDRSAGQGGASSSGTAREREQRLWRRAAEGSLSVSPAKRVTRIRTRAVGRTSRPGLPPAGNGRRGAVPRSRSPPVAAKCRACRSDSRSGSPGPRGRAGGS